MIFQYDIKDDSDEEVTIDLEIGYGHNGETTITTPGNVLAGPINGNISGFVIGKNNELKKKKIIVSTSVDLTDTGITDAAISIKLKGGIDEKQFEDITPTVQDDTTAHFTLNIYFF
jgi:hypothetical protein